MVRPDTVRYFFVVRESLLGHLFFFSVSLVLFVCFKDENGFFLFVCLFSSAYAFSLTQKIGVLQLFVGANM